MNMGTCKVNAHACTLPCSWSSNIDIISMVGLVVKRYIIIEGPNSKGRLPTSGTLNMFYVHTGGGRWFELGGRQ